MMDKIHVDKKNTEKGLELEIEEKVIKKPESLYDSFPRDRKSVV